MIGDPGAWRFQQLRQLEQQGVVQRHVAEKAPGIRVEYSLSLYGETLRPILDSMCDWRLAHMSRSSRNLRAVSDR